MADAKKDKLQIRNSTVDFLVFTKDAHEDGIEVRVQDHDVWLTQKAIARLFDVDRSVVTKHLKNVYESGELSEDATCANFAQVADNGKTYHYKFYSLSAIIAVGYRINSGRATQFRQWATKVLDTFTKQGYVLDKSRLINGQIFARFRRFGPANGASIRKLRIFTPLLWTTLSIARPQRISLPQFRIRCTMPSMAAQRQRSLWHEPITPRNTWG